MERLTDEQLSYWEQEASVMDSWVYGVPVKEIIADLRHYKQLSEKRGKVLEWYAEKHRYRSKPTDEDFTEWDAPDVNEDGGERAREALQEDTP